MRGHAGRSAALAFSVEAEAIDVPLRSTTVTTVNSMSSRGFAGGIAMGTPGLAKYTLRPGAIAPFVELGPSFRLPTSGLSTHGITVGIGAQVHVKVLKIQPAVRYTRWAQNELENPWRAQTRLSSW